MNILAPPHHPPASPNAPWVRALFSAKAVARGGIVRRSVSSVEREIGRAVFEAEVRRRNFHLLEIGDQYIVICNTGHMRLVC